MKKPDSKTAAVILAVLFLAAIAASTAYSRTAAEQQKTLIELALPQSATLQWNYETRSTMRPASEEERDRGNGVGWVTEVLVPFEAYSGHMGEIVGSAATLTLDGSDEPSPAQNLLRSNLDNGDVLMVLGYTGSTQPVAGGGVTVGIEHVGLTEFSNLIPPEAIHRDSHTGEHYLFTVRHGNGAWGREYYVQRESVTFGVPSRVGDLAFVLTPNLAGTPVVVWSEASLSINSPVRFSDSMLRIYNQGSQDREDGPSGNIGLPGSPDQSPGAVADAGSKENTIRILEPISSKENPYVPGLITGFTHIYINMFKELYPEVEIITESYADEWDWYPTYSQLTALVTRLIADPPDIFLFDPTMISFEKMNIEAVFTDLNVFIDGERGIDRADYFENILSAMETRGGLYHISPYIGFDMVMLNKQLFELIGVDTDTITSITMQERLDYYDMVAEARERPFAFSNSFSFVDVLLSEKLYDVDTGAVSADTEVMRENIKRAMEIPIGFYTRFTPERWTPGGIISGSAGNNDFLSEDGRTYLFYPFARDHGPDYTRVFFLQDYPAMRYSLPVHYVSGNGEIRFTSGPYSTFSILRQSPNQDLAWEFVRLIMEYQDSMERELDSPLSVWEDPNAGYIGTSHFPVNRARFDNQVGARVGDILEVFVRWVGLQSIVADVGAYKAERVPACMDYFRNLMEMLNFENRRNMAVFQELVYPDIWLLHTGQQTVERTMANIQSRLELYVNE